MSDAAAAPERSSLLRQDPRTRRRNAAEARFRAAGIAAIGLGLACLAVLLITILWRGLPAFTQTELVLPVELSAAKLDPGGRRDPADLKKVTTFGYAPVIRAALEKLIADKGIESEVEAADLLGLLSRGSAAKVRDRVLAQPQLIGSTVTFTLYAASRVDGYLKGRVTRASIADDRSISAAQLDLADALRRAGLLERRFNPAFIFGADASDSRPEQAGIGIAMLGSLYIVLTVLLVSLPVGVAASVYLEEFAPKNRWTDLIEVNIANLAAVPSIVFGILGLAAFIQFAGLPRSAPLVGGLVLTLMTLPRIIIPARAALKAVPPSIRDAALGVGASRMQAVLHHVLPLAVPGILTGIIIGLAQALGETAPLLLIGMVGFIATNPPAGLLDGFTSPNSAMPAQIYEWAKRADPAFYERAWGGIVVLLLFMILMNLVAVVLRRRFERRW
jgi:phosphate transport system permease protein